MISQAGFSELCHVPNPIISFSDGIRTSWLGARRVGHFWPGIPHRARPAQPARVVRIWDMAKPRNTGLRDHFARTLRFPSSLQNLEPPPIPRAPSDSSSPLPVRPPMTHRLSGLAHGRVGRPPRGVGAARAPWPGVAHEKRGGAGHKAGYRATFPNGDRPIRTPARITLWKARAPPVVEASPPIDDMCTLGCGGAGSSGFGAGVLVGAPVGVPIGIDGWPCQYGGAGWPCK
jgi:hypothetical protein